MPQEKAAPSQAAGRRPPDARELRFLDSVISYIPLGKTGLHWEYLPAWLRRDVLERYQTSKMAKVRVNAHLRIRKYQAKWPRGWWSRVDPEPLFDKAERSGRPPDLEDRAWLTRMCENVRATHKPPLLDRQQRTRLERYGALPGVFQLMGIPYLKHEADREAMIRFWNGGGEGTGGPKDREDGRKC